MESKADSLIMEIRKGLDVVIESCEELKTDLNDLKSSPNIDEKIVEIIGMKTVKSIVQVLKSLVSEEKLLSLIIPQKKQIKEEFKKDLGNLKRGILKDVAEKFEEMLRFIAQSHASTASSVEVRNASEQVINAMEYY